MDLQQRHISVSVEPLLPLAWHVLGFAGGKDGLPIWSTAADVSIINMKSQATDRRWFSR